MDREVVISLPGTILDHESFDKVILPQLNLLQLRYQKGHLVSDKISIDLGNITRASPYAILGITLVAEILYEMVGRKVDLILPRPARGSDKDFFNFKWDYPFLGTIIGKVTNLRNGPTVISRKKNPIFLPTTKVEDWQDIMHLVKELQKWFCPSLVEVLGYSDHQTIQFITILSELCQNIFHHSPQDNPTHGYLAMQVHDDEASSGIEFAVVDTGIGIPNSLRSSSQLLVRYQGKLSDDMQAVRLACNANVSSKDRGGLGLYAIRQIIERTQGILYIRSGSAKVSFYYNRQKKRRSEARTNFLGTQIWGLLRKEVINEPKDLFL